MTANFQRMLDQSIRSLDLSNKMNMAFWHDQRQFENQLAGLPQASTQPTAFTTEDLKSFSSLNTPFPALQFPVLQQPGAAPSIPDPWALRIGGEFIPPAAIRSTPIPDFRLPQQQPSFADTIASLTIPFTPEMPTGQQATLPLTHPLGGRGRIGQGPNQRGGTHFGGSWQDHNAVDIAVPSGSPVYAVEAGVIGSRIGPLNSSNPRYAGQRVYVENQKNQYYYAHLSRIAVRPGQRVREGQLIGYSGTAANVPHLHFATKNGNPLSMVSRATR